MNRDSFLKTYCRWVTDWRGDEVISLKEKANKDCVFWDNGCKVYEERPLQCVTFPFWESVLSSSKNWEIAASDCPGMNSGALHSLEDIEKTLEKREGHTIIKRAGGEE